MKEQPNLRIRKRKQRGTRTENQIYIKHFLYVFKGNQQNKRIKIKKIIMRCRWASRHTKLKTHTHNKHTTFIIIQAKCTKL